MDLTDPFNNDPEYIESVVIPKLMDFNYLKSLPKNTIGAGYYKIVKEYGIEDLYNQRFSQEEANKFKGAFSSFAEEIRANCSRHILLTHDNWHILTGYNTDTLGEALLQTITAKCFNLYQAHLVGFFGMLKVVKETKSWLPFKAWLECLKLAKQIDNSFVSTNFAPDVNDSIANFVSNYKENLLNGAVIQIDNAVLSMLRTD
mgnify:CR=1 FL=1